MAVGSISRVVLRAPRNRPKVLEGSRGVALLSLDLGTLEGGGWSVPRLGRFTPRKTRYPLYRRLGGPQGRSTCAKNLAPPGFVPRTEGYIILCLHPFRVFTEVPDLWGQEDSTLSTFLSSTSVRRWTCIGIWRCILGKKDE
jgi:hypothetical protein